MNRMFPAFTVTGRQNIEKMDLIYNQMRKEHGAWTNFVKEAIFEKWDRQVFHNLKKEHGVYAPVIQLMENVYDYKTFRKYGMSFKEAYKNNVVTAEELDKFYNIVEMIRNEILSSGAGEKLLQKDKLFNR